jgi:hypothetical protein
MKVVVKSDVSRIPWPMYGTLDSAVQIGDYLDFGDNNYRYRVERRIWIPKRAGETDTILLLEVKEVEWDG